MRFALFTICLFVATSHAAIQQPKSPHTQLQSKDAHTISQSVNVANLPTNTGKKQRVFIELYDNKAVKLFYQRVQVDSNQLVTARLRQQQTLINKLSAKMPDMTIKAQLSKSQNTLVAELFANDIHTLVKNPDIKRIHPSYDLKTLITDSVSQVKADQVWHLNGDNTVTGQGTTIAVIDTGIDYSHPDLGSCLGASCKVKGGYDFINNDADPMDDNSHGTHVAGIIAAKGTLQGLAPDAFLLAYKACDQYGNCPDYTVIQAIEMSMDPDGDPHTDDAADIINLSLGSSDGEPDSPLSTAVNAASAAGILVVIAAGNDGGYGNYKIGSPGNADTALTVAASKDLSNIADFSSRGYIKSNGHVKPEVAAPGTNINSTVLNGEYQQFSGTSMAAPTVAGAAALLLSNNSELTNEELKSLLMANTTDLGEAFNLQGTGVIDVLKAAQSPIVSNKGIINLGWHAELSNFSHLETLELKNTSTTEQHLTISIRKQGDNPIDYSLSESAMSLQPLQATSINLTVDIPEMLATKPMEDPSYIAWIDIESATGIQSLPVIVMHTETITVFFEDFSEHEVSLYLVDKTLGHVESYYPNSTGEKEHTFFKDSGEFAVYFKAESYGPYTSHVGAALDIPAGSSTSFSLAQNWHSVKYAIDKKNGESIDTAGTLPHPFKAENFLVLPEYGKAFYAAQTAWGENDTAPQLYIMTPSDNMYYDAFVTLLDNQIAYQDLALTQRLDASSIQSNGDSLFDLSASELNSINFAYAKQGGKIYDVLVPYNYYAYTYPKLDVSGFGTYQTLDTPIQTRQTLISPRPDELFSFVGNSQTYSNSDNEISDFSEVHFTTANYTVNELDELVLSSLYSTKSSLKSVAIENKDFDFKAGYLLPSFKAKVVNQDGAFAISYDDANSTALFSDSLLTNYKGTVQYTTNDADAQADRETDNDELTIEELFYRPADIELQQTSNGSYLEFNQFTLDGTPVSLVATLEYDLGADDFSPPVISELIIKTLGEEHTHLAQGNGEIQLKVTDEDINHTAIFYKATSEQNWHLLAESSTASVTAQLSSLPKEAYDLKVEATDGTGNKLTYTASPGFFAVEDCKYDSDCDGRWDQFDTGADNDADNDNVKDADDAFPFDPTEWLDTDNDGIGNNADPDDDNDSYADSEDAFPLDAAEWLDTDNDGTGNNADLDDDNDSYADSEDAFPLDTNEWLDTDSDGTGNNADSDDDNDSYPDSEDTFPLDATEWLDTDSDGTGNNADPDDDNDGYADSEDTFPLDATEWLDTDSDGTGNNADTDDDNDSYADSEDAFPHDATEWLDTDSDGTGNNADTDDDNDGVADSNDAYPLDASRSSNNTSTGDNQDTSSGGSTNLWILPVLALVVLRRRKKVS